MLEDKRLKIFAAVVECGNFTAAASSLGISQPAVSQSIAELERLLGVKLFERTRGEALLTEEGLRFEGYARQILHWYRVAEEAFSPLSSGKEPVAPVRIPLDESSDAEIWSSGGDLHIEIKHK